MSRQTKITIAVLSIFTIIMYITFPIIKDSPDKYTLIYYLQMMFKAINTKGSNFFYAIVVLIFQTLLLVFPVLCYLYLAVKSIISATLNKKKMNGFIPSIAAVACNLIAVIFFQALSKIELKQSDGAFKITMVSAFKLGSPCFLLYFSTIISVIILVLVVIARITYNKK